MSETTPRLALPLIQVGQAQKEVTHNAALTRIDALLHLSVASRSTVTPPTSPFPGVRYVVPAGATGAWGGEADKIASWDGSVWKFDAPATGMLCWVEDEAVFGVHANGAWAFDFLPVGGLRIGGADLFGAARDDVANPAGGTVIDVEARAALSALLTYLRAQGVLGS